MDSSIEKLSLSIPSEIDQETVSLAENVPIEAWFSLIDIVLDNFPDFPESSVIIGNISSVLFIVIEKSWYEVLAASSFAEILREYELSLSLSNGFS